MRTLNVLFAAFGNMIGSVTVPNFFDFRIRWVDQDHDGEIENSGKSIFKFRNQNFCYIHEFQVIVFDLGYLPVGAVGTQQVRYHEKIVKNIKSVRDSDFKNAFPGVFNFTFGILNSQFGLKNKLAAGTVSFQVASSFYED